MTVTILIIINVFSALAIIVLALMQQSKSDMGSAFGGGGSQSMFGSRGSANFLSRSTAIMCILFFVSSLALAYTYAKRNDNSSVLGDSVIQLTEQAAPETSLDGDAAVPSVPNTNSDAGEESAVPATPEVEAEAQSSEQAIPEVPEAEVKEAIEEKVAEKAE